jgi:hypothetical protein
VDAVAASQPALWVNVIVVTLSAAMAQRRIRTLDDRQATQRTAA